MSPMSKAIVFIVVSLFAVTATGQTATRLYFEGFEGNDTAWVDNNRIPDSIWNYVANVTNKPYEGNRCIRGNFKTGSDPITGLPGSNALLMEFNFGNVSNQTPNGLYVKFMYRLDASNWAGTGNEGAPSTGWNGKTAYITSEADGTLSLYNSAGYQGSPTTHTLATNNGSQMSQAWVFEHWGTYLITGTHSPATLSPDGNWHSMEYFANYIANTFSMWFDGVKVTDGRFPDGNYPIHPSWRMRGLQIMFVKAAKVQYSTNTTAGDYAAGWQVDNVEAWDWLPDQNVPPPSDVGPISNLVISGGHGNPGNPGPE